MRGNFFAKLDLSDRIPLAPHDENLPGDVRTGGRVNYEWRVWIASNLDELLEFNQRILSESDYDDLEKVYLDMMADFYT